MIVSKVLSYKNAWNVFHDNNSPELQDILDVLPSFILEYNESRNQSGRPMFYELWEQKLYEKNWSLIDRTIYTDTGIRINIGRIGPIKNNVSAIVNFGHPDSLNRWLFQQSPIACKYNIVNIPIMLVPVDEFARQQNDRPILNRYTFEMYQRQLEPLMPMSHGYPFLILGYSNQYELFEPEIIEIESDSFIQNENIVIDRCIEFPPQYYHAGINILSFFGTYIKEQYPDEEAKVKIEQHDNIVRLIVETKNGEIEVVEKALEEYQLIVSGQRAPESIVKSEKLVLELRNELRIAKYRIESQQDIIQLQNVRIDQLFNIVGAGLAAKPTLSIDFHPSISATCNVTINQDISLAIGNLSELKELLPKEDDNLLVINDLEGALNSIEKETNPEIVKKSSAMSKFKRFMDKISDTNDNLRKSIDTIETGWDIIKDLAGKYNSIAEWCGLPQVPKIFTK